MFSQILKMLTFDLMNDDDIIYIFIMKVHTHPIILCAMTTVFMIFTSMPLCSTRLPEKQNSAPEFYLVSTVVDQTIVFWYSKYLQSSSIQHLLIACSLNWIISHLWGCLPIIMEFIFKASTHCRSNTVWN